MAELELTRSKEMVMNQEILNYIQEVQMGRSGIYPYHVTIEVAVHFQITFAEAQAHVLEHMEQELRLAYTAIGN